jgi:hypothetical protein
MSRFSNLSLCSGLVMSLFGLMGQTATADTIMLEDFSYSEGALLGNNGGSGFTQAWSAQAPSITPDGWEVFNASGMTYPNYVGGGGAGAHVDTSVAANTNIERAFQAPSASTPTTYLAWIACYGNVGNRSLVGLRNSVADTWGMFAGNTSENSKNWAYYDGGAYRESSLPVSIDVNHLVVMRFDWNDATGGVDATKMYLDPNLLAGEAGNTPISSATGLADTGASTSINLLRLMGWQQAYTGGTMNLDGIRYTTGWNDLVAGAATPEPGACVMVITGLIGLLAYAWRKRK